MMKKNEEKKKKTTTAATATVQVIWAQCNDLQENFDSKQICWTE